jgi:hypothetical protein
MEPACAELYQRTVLASNAELLWCICSTQELWRLLDNARK